jgi:cell division protein FtsL
MKKILLPLFVLLLLSACDSKEDQAKHDAMVAQKARAELMAELKAKEEARKKAEEEARKKDSKLEKIGIEVNGSKIIIDTNKTKTFFKQMTQKLQKKMEKIQHDLQKGKLEENQTGIRIDQEKINIDLNKTKGFLESWGKKMQEVMQSVEEMTKQIDPAIEGKQSSDSTKVNK